MNSAGSYRYWAELDLAAAKGSLAIDAHTPADNQDKDWEDQSDLQSGSGTLESALGMDQTDGYLHTGQTEDEIGKHSRRLLAAGCLEQAREPWISGATGSGPVQS